MTLKKESKYKVGDWVFCEFKLQQIKGVKDGKVQEVSDGSGSHSANNLNDRCFPMSLRVKNISDRFQYQCHKIFAQSNSNLNYPDFHRWLVQKWCDACKSYKDDAAVNKRISEMNDWVEAVLARCDELKQETIGGVKLFRQT